MLALGRLQEGQDRMTADFREEKKNAHEHRAIIHRRIDEQSQQIGHLETTVAISGEIDAQIREEIKALKETVDNNHAEVAPALEEWKRLKTLGVGISGLIALAGLTIGGVVVWTGNAAVDAIRHWLRIN
jgi:chromosome segregation ATPase